VASSHCRATPQFLTGFVADHVRIPVCMPFYTSMCQLRPVNRRCGNVARRCICQRRRSGLPPAVARMCAGDLVEQILAKSPVVGGRAAKLRKTRRSAMYGGDVQDSSRSDACRHPPRRCRTHGRSQGHRSNANRVPGAVKAQDERTCCRFPVFLNVQPRKMGTRLGGSERILDEHRGTAGSHAAWPWP
jgi:hypothetical protein